MRVKAPSFQFYAADFLTGTMGMSLEAQGAYIRLLCWSWVSGGGLVRDHTRLAAGLGIDVRKFKRIFHELRSKFVVRNNRFINVRLEEVRAIQTDFREKQAEKGRKRAAQRWGTDDSRGYVPAIAEPQPKHSSSSSSSKDQDQDQERVPPSAARTHAVVMEFQRLHLDRCGTKATLEPKDVRRLARFAEDRHGDHVTADHLLRAFFASRDPFIETAGFTVAVFLSQTGRLLASLTARQAPARVDWRDECTEFHDSRCTNPHFHAAMMAKAGAA